MMRMLIALLALGLGSAALAAPPKPLFAEQAPLRLTLKGPIQALAQGPANAEKAVPATLSVGGETLAVSLSPRGITRRQKDVCSFPPIRVEFTDKPGPASVFKGQKKLKLVTHCRTTPSFQQLLLLEYASYRMYNLLTPQSFDVRLAQIDYVDDGGKPITTRLGFFIEDIDDVAKRNGLTKVKTQQRLSVAALGPREAARYVAFQYMIGNLDWAMTAGPAGTDCCHNSRPLGAEGATSGLIPVPYDFDFAGVVDAPYATPPEGISVPNVRVRKYRGYCRHNAEAQAAMADLAARRAALTAVFDEVPALEAKTRGRALGYLNVFFEQAGNPASVAKIVGTCIG